MYAILLYVKYNNMNAIYYYFPVKVFTRKQIYVIIHNMKLYNPPFRATALDIGTELKLKPDSAAGHESTLNPATHSSTVLSPD